jgi:hypothetical protein
MTTPPMAGPTSWPAYLRSAASTPSSFACARATGSLARRSTPSHQSNQTLYLSSKKKLGFNRL